MTPKEKLVKELEHDLLYDYRKRHSSLMYRHSTPTKMPCLICNAMVKRENLRNHLMTHSIEELKDIELEYKI